MDLLHLVRILTMSKNNEESEKITLTDPDTGATLEIPTVNVTEWDDSHKYYGTNPNDYTITVDTGSYSDLVNVGILDDIDFTSIFERPNNETIRKRYTAHKKIDNIQDVGLHVLEKMSKRGKE